MGYFTKNIEDWAGVRAENGKVTDLEIIRKKISSLPDSFDNLSAHKYLGLRKKQLNNVALKITLKLVDSSVKCQTQSLC